MGGSFLGGLSERRTTKGERRRGGFSPHPGTARRPKPHHAHRPPTVRERGTQLRSSLSLVSLVSLESLFFSASRPPGPFSAPLLRYGTPCSPACPGGRRGGHPMAAATVNADELHEIWRLLSPEERIESFGCLSAEEAQDFFLDMRPADQLLIVRQSPPAIRRSWIRLLAPDDAADLLPEGRGAAAAVLRGAGVGERPELLALLDPATRREVSTLLAYEEDDAGGLMSPRYA